MAAPGLMQFILNNAGTPSLVQLGIVRDGLARDAFVGGIETYNLYDQGSVAVIQARAQHAAAQPNAVASAAQAGAGTGTTFCSICQKNKNDFARHNQEIHARDPGLTWFCPHCAHPIFRNSDIEYDVHLAGCQLDFRGRHGQDILWASTHKPDLTRFPKAVLVFLVIQNQPRVEDLRIVRLRLRRALSSAGLLDGHPNIRGRRWPMRLDLKNPNINVYSMTKNELCAYIVDFRLHFKSFNTWFRRADIALRDHQQMTQLAAQNLLPAPAPVQGPSTASGTPPASPEAAVPGLLPASGPTPGPRTALTISEASSDDVAQSVLPAPFDPNTASPTPRPSAEAVVQSVPVDPALVPGPNAASPPPHGLTQARFRALSQAPLLAPPPAFPQTPLEAFSEPHPQDPSQAFTQASSQAFSQSSAQAPPLAFSQVPSQAFLEYYPQESPETFTQAPSQMYSYAPSQAFSHSSAQAPPEAFAQAPSQAFHQPHPQAPFQTFSQAPSPAFYQPSAQAFSQAPSQALPQDPPQACPEHYTLAPFQAVSQPSPQAPSHSFSRTPLHAYPQSYHSAAPQTTPPPQDTATVVTQAPDEEYFQVWM